MAERWYCGVALPREEHRAVLNVSRQGFRTHLPQFVRRAPRKAPAVRLMFPRYFFVQFDADDQGWRKIWHTYGVQRVICGLSPERPTPMPDAAVEELMARGRAGDGVIDEEAAEFPVSMVGKHARVVGGPFVGWDGVCQWSDERRVGVLLDMLGAARVVNLPREFVEATDG